MNKWFSALFLWSLLLTGCSAPRAPAPLSWDEAFGNIPEESVNKDLQQIQQNLNQAQ